MRIILISDTHGSATYLAALKSKIDSIIKGAADLGEEVMFVHAGDFVGANRMFSHYSAGMFEVETTRALVEKIHPSRRFYVIGNHDTMHKEELLVKFIEQCEFKAVCSNCEFQAGSLLRGKTLESTTIEMRGGKKIGITGLLTPETLKASNHKFASILLDLSQSIEKITSIIREMNAQGVFDFVVMSHEGLDADKTIAEKLLQAADCKFNNLYICGGHSHTSDLERPISLSNGERAVHVVNGGFDGLHLVELNVDEKTFALRPADVLHHAPFGQAADPQMMAILGGYAQSIAARNLGVDVRKVLFRVGGDLSGLELDPSRYSSTESHLRVTDSSITRLAADAIWRMTGVECAFLPAAAFRTNFKAGEDVTYERLFEMFLANNKIVRLKVTGREIVQALALGQREGYQHWIARGTLLHPSDGFSYVYDCSGKSEEVIRDVQVNGQPLELDREYTIATTDWVVNGAKLFSSSKIIAVQMPTPGMFAAQSSEDPRKIVDMVQQHILQHPVGEPVSESFGQRITAIPGFHEQEQMRKELEAKGVSRGGAAIPRTVPVNMPEALLLAAEASSSAASKPAALVPPTTY